MRVQILLCDSVTGSHMNPSDSDVLSAVLGVIRLDAAFFSHAELSCPWATFTPRSSEAAPNLAPGAEHLIIYHYVIGGACYARLPGGPRIVLDAGDIVMFPHGDAHQMGGGEEVPPIPADVTLSHWKQHGISAARFGGGGEVTKLICGFLLCDPKVSAMVLAGLPRLVRVNIREEPSGHWLEESIRFAVLQSRTPQSGGQAVLTKLAEALFVETIRRYVRGISGDVPGWITGARDPDVAAALKLLHEDPSRSWTIADLARAVGISRSILAKRFSLCMGEAPISYLTRRRLQLAAQSLATTMQGVAEIAADVGYDSEAAFNRAFKRMFDVPPVRYRNGTRRLQGNQTGL